MNLKEVVHVLSEIAILLDLSSINRFKGKAIRKAIHSLEDSSINLTDLVKNNALQTLLGIGPSIEKIILEIVHTGDSKYRKKLESLVPLSLAPFLKISGIKRHEILLLHEHFLVKSLEDFQQCTSDQLLEIGISEKRQKLIQKNIKNYKRYGPSYLLWTAIPIAEFLKKKLFQSKIVTRCEISGDIRRCSNTIKQIIFVVETKSPNTLFHWILKQSWMETIIKQSSSSIIFQCFFGIAVKILITKKNFAKALFLSTGSLSHIRALNGVINSQGIAKNVHQLEMIETEKDIYQKANLQYIPPELRENKGEIQRAIRKDLPELIKKTDIKGVYHCHTIDSDGIHSFQELAFAAEKFYQWKYIGISDHSKSCKIANGINEEQLLKQITAINEFNLTQSCSCKVLSGIECDILLNGSLDFSDDILKKLDFVIISIHSHFNLSKSLMTKRIIKAIENPYSTILGHVSGRLLLRRSGYLLDLSKIIDACIANHKIIEINAQPSRLDMDWSFWQKAVNKGLRCVINPDAHSIQELKYYEAGVNVARKGWLTSNDVINTSSDPIK